jgi:hypothetical protein
VCSLIAGLALTGCVQSPNTAIIVNGERTTITELWRAVDACADVTGLSAESIWRDIGNHMVRAAVAQVIIDGRGISYSEAELVNIVQNGAGSHVLADPTCKAVFLGSASWTLLEARLGPDEFYAVVQDVDVVVNPRYGYWDPASGAAVGSGSLSSTLVPR